MNNPMMRILSFTLAVALIIGTVPVVYADAPLVPTHAVLSQIDSELNREQLLDMLDTEAVVRSLERNGVSIDEARARVAALSDQEVRMLNERMQELPAGANIVGVLFSVFIILLITDLLGLTNVFPFTRN